MFDGDWPDLAPGLAQLKTFLTPDDM
jgi:hypothetical protein